MILYGPLDMNVKLDYEYNGCVIIYDATTLIKYGFACNKGRIKYPN